MMPNSHIFQSCTQSLQSSWLKNEGLWHNPFVFPTNPEDPVLLGMCRVFQDGGHPKILQRKREEFFVVVLCFLHNMIYSINYNVLSLLTIN